MLCLLNQPLTSSKLNSGGNYNAGLIVAFTLFRLDFLTFHAITAYIRVVSTYIHTVQAPRNIITYSQSIINP